MSQSFYARVQKQGRITIPKTLRAVLNIKQGDIVEVSIKKVEKGEDSGMAPDRKGTNIPG